MDKIDIDNFTEEQTIIWNWTCPCCDINNIEFECPVIDLTHVFCQTCGSTFEIVK